MKISKKSIKRYVRDAVQSILVLGSMIMGFFHTYTQVFCAFDIITAWTLIATVCLSLLSTVGIFYWIMKSKY